MADSPKTEFHRLFIAISVPAIVKSEIQKVQNELVGMLPDHAVRWTRPEHFHLTLRFLGNAPTERTGQLAECLRTAVSNFFPLELKAEEVGFFPGRGFPRVLWVSVRDECQQLA